MPSVKRRRAIRQCLVCHANVLDFPPPEGHGDFKQRVNMTMTKLCLTHRGRVRGAFFCALIKCTTNLFSNNQLTEFPWLVTQRPKEHTGMSPRKGFKCPFQCLSFFPALISFISLGKWLNFAEDQLGWAQWAHSHIIKSELGLNAIISAECMSFSGSSINSSWNGLQSHLLSWLPSTVQNLCILCMLAAHIHQVSATKDVLSKHFVEWLHKSDPEFRKISLGFGE